MPVTDKNGQVLVKIMGADGKPVVGAHVQVSQIGATPPPVDPPPPPPPPPPPSSSVVDVPATVDATGATDVTAALQGLIDTLTLGRTLRLAVGKLYRVDGTLLFSKRDAALDLNGSTLQAGPEAGQAGLALRNLALVRIKGGKVSIMNGTLRGRNPMGGTGGTAYDSSREAQHCLDVQGCDQLRLTNVNALDTWGDCLYLGQDAGKWCEDVIVKGGEMARTGRQGIAMVAARHVVLDGVYIHDMRRATFNMEPTTDQPAWGADDIEIKNCRTGPGRLLWFSSLGGGFAVSNIRIHHNTMEAVAAGTFFFMRAPLTPTDKFRGPITIEDNVFLAGGSPAGGFELGGCKDVTIRRNHCTFPASRAMTAVDLIRCQNVKVENNVFVGAARAVRADAATTGLTESGNTLTSEPPPAPPLPVPLPVPAWDIKVAGNQLVDGAGARHVLVGVAQYFGAYGWPLDGEMAPIKTWFSANCGTVFDQMRSAGMNLLRLGIGEDVDLADPTYLAEVRRIVDVAATRGVWVATCPFGGIWGWPATEDRLNTFNRRLVTRLGSAPNWLCEIVNEPNGHTAQTWRDAITRNIKGMRAFGYARPIFVQTPHWAWTFPRPEVDAVRATDPNLVWVAHRYPVSDINGPAAGAADVAAFDAEWTAHGARYPMVLGEWGPWNGSYGNNGSFEKNVAGWCTHMALHVGAMITANRLQGAWPWILCWGDTPPPGNGMLAEGYERVVGGAATDLNAWGRLAFSLGGYAR